MRFWYGGGGHTWYLAREGFDCYGFDGAPSAVRRVEEKLKKENLSAHLQCCTGQEVSYPDDFFDAIIDSACIYANGLNDIELMYRKCLSFLKLGGKIITTAFGKNTSGYGGGRQLEEDTYTDMTEGNLRNRGTAHFYTKESLTYLIEKIGFKNVKCGVDLYTGNDSVVELLICQAEK